jgi:hypothetical protein
MPNVWIFNANPKVYPLDQELEDPDLTEACWTLNTSWHQIKKGDLALHWISGERGFFSLVEITSDPYWTWYEKEDVNENYLKPGKNYFVDYRYIVKFQRPFLEPEIKKIPGLENLQIFRYREGSVKKIKPDEWDILYQELKNRGFLRSPQGP